MESQMKWLDQINEEIKNNGPSIDDKNQRWRKYSIYKVPSQITDLNQKAYKPQAISFGPYHYGEENLKAMEEHKHRALVHFLRRCEKPIELLFQRLNQVAHELRDSYKPLDPIWKNDTLKFLRMMILDGCFILEILRVNDCETLVDDYDENDPVFGEHGQSHVMPYIKRDMLILENQIPMTVLHTLFEVEAGVDLEDHHVLNMKIVQLLNPIFLTDTFSNKLVDLGKCMHILDLFRKSAVQPSHRRIPTNAEKKMYRRLSKEDSFSFIRSAIEFEEAGIRFTSSETRCLRDVSFYRGVVSLPTIIISDDTEYIFLNLIAFERLHVAVGSEVASFLCLMATIINSAMDVQFLRQNGILLNALGSDEVVAKLFDSMSREITVDHNDLHAVRNKMIQYSEIKWKRYHASLIHTYFKSPWTMVSLAGAIFLFVFTIIQTIYTVLSFYHDKK